MARVDRVTANPRYWPYPALVAQPDVPLPRRPLASPQPVGAAGRAGALAEKPWGICLSGGGVRSASLCLGVVQQMHEHGMIHGERRATYLSAVSGGSYLAGGLGMVTAGPLISDPPDGKPRRTAVGAGQDRPAFGPGSPEESLLRTRTRYLSHGSGGPLAAVWRYLLGVTLNLILLALTVEVVAVPVGWLYGLALPELREHQRGLTGTAALYHRFDTPAAVWYLIGGLAGLAVLCGLGWVMARWRIRQINQWLGMASAVLLGLAALLWLVVVALPHVLDFVRVGLSRHLGTSPRTGQPAAWGGQTKMGIGAAAGAVGSVLTGAAALRARAATPPLVQKAERTVQRMVVPLGQRLAARFRGPLLNLAASVSGPLLVACTFLAFVLVGASQPIGTYRVGELRPLLIVGLPLLALLVVWQLGDLNAWSLHPFYRRRLVAAYALRRVDADPDVAPTSNNAVDGVDIDHLPEDGAEARLAEFIGPASPTPAGRRAPFPELLICAAANIADYGATPTGSHVTSFVFSQREVGGPLVGSMPTVDYARIVDPSGAARMARVRNPSADEVTVPSAVAIAGAAVAPAMGKMTRAPLRFVLSLLNIRLGVWLPNPRRVAPLVGRPGRQSKFRGRPHPGYLVREMFGLNRLDARYLYLTDGGHYENLGLVELLRRRCRWIWCVDAAGDSIDTFNTIGEALALADAELGIKLQDFQPERVMAPDPEVSAARAAQGKPPLVRQPYCAGRIVYPDGTEGTLVVIKAGVWADAPWEVQSFYERSRKFPCDPTSNQLYTAERFDAYRALGAAAMGAAWQEYGAAFDDFRGIHH